MDAGLTPLFPECGTNDVNAATSAACGQAMQPLCSAGWGDPANGNTLKSMLLNPQSNCWRWMNAIQESNAVLTDKIIAPGAPFLDAAMNAYCRGDGSAGSLTAECGCLSFPVRAAKWCSVSHCVLGAPWSMLSLTVEDGVDQAEACPGLEFAQQRADSNELDVVQFGQCSPYPCWLSDCYKPPSQQLLSSLVLEAQMSGNCPEICGQFLGGNKVTISPMPPGSFSFTGDVSGLSGCCVATSVTTCPAYPALLACEPTTWNMPVNGRMVFGTPVTNDGDDAALLTFASCSLPFCTVEPQNMTILGHSVAQFNIVCDQSSISSLFESQGSQSLALAPEFYFTYPDWSSKTQTSVPWSTSCNIIVGAASGPIHEPKVEFPLWFWIVVMVAIVVFVALFVWSFFIEHASRTLINELPE